MNKDRLIPHIDEALTTARTASKEDAWHALEKAHILSQPFAWQHVRVHMHMFRRSWRDRRWRELLGQLPRLLLAGPGSLFGRYPRGNRGTTAVSMFKPESMPPELESLLAE